ncbi:hypothetical protein FA15DRAFT_665791 [Coprinopsis marcescibilis]|uniref:Xylanolytic transcriptional activator regulatory domain-containing protein n=1 Tax=Coprinopsis marcescibilis TaxID=230819 RepID=A0A5C3L638_COPMA|nr:hypothetical protein FA15DRAFT_665791 [Coprinopsis marcescibilis]
MSCHFSHRYTLMIDILPATLYRALVLGLSSVVSKYTPPAPEPSSISPVSNAPHFPQSVFFELQPRISLNTPTKDVLSYIFAPPVSSSRNEAPSFSPIQPKSPYDAWGELACKLEEESFRAEFMLDLVEVFFQIVHTRLPLLNPAQFRNRLGVTGKNKLPETPPYEGPPLHPALVATVVAWGSKFSEHPLLVSDRKRPSGQSLLAKTLVDRARDLAEALRVHRIPSSDHVVISLLIEPLQSQNPEDQNGYHGFWLTAATRHLLALGINHKSTMASLPDKESRGTMIFAWWMTCISDAYASAYYRRKPILDDDDYDIDFYIVVPSSEETSDGSSAPSTREQLEFLGYYRAAHALARAARQMSRQLWKPATDSDGIPFETLSTFVSVLTEWRTDYLSLVGVPNNYDGEWDFVSAVSSCASDATYHVMWIILFTALDDFGIKELNQTATPPPNLGQIEVTKQKILDEAMHGALRIAGLAAVLTSNGYLRLDPAVMHVSCIHAGTFLARLGRPEVTNCIAGLEQYSYSYEEAGDQAQELKRLFGMARSGELELNHMASVTPRSPAGQSVPQISSGHHQSPSDHAMVIDTPAKSARTNGTYSTSTSYNGFSR